MQKNTLSLLITYYNEKELFTECMESIAVQTVYPDELLIYDDCSPFPAIDYIPANFSIPYRIIRGTINNGSPAVGRNILMQEAQSDYLHFQDADDLLKTDCIQKIKDALVKEKFDVIINEVEACKDGQLIHHNHVKVDKIKELGAVVFGIKYCYPTQSITFRKDIMNTVAGFWGNEYLSASEDYEFFARLMYEIKSYHIIEDNLVIYRLKNQSRNADFENWAAATLQAVDLLAKHLPQKYNRLLAERANMVGVSLYSRQFYTKAKEAFGYANTLSKNAIDATEYSMLYKYLVPVIGIYNTLRISKIYQNIFPQKIRQLLKK
jgi:glycosyltransferase involved in cell wall biosynthesis